MVTTDNVILLGFVAESDGEFKLVGEQFTEEPYGIGIKKGDVEFCEFINETLTENEDAYNKAWADTAGKIEGTEAPKLPEAAPCAERARRPGRGAAAPRRAVDRPPAEESRRGGGDRQPRPVLVGFLRSLGICLWGMVGSLLLGTVIAAVPGLAHPVAALVRHRLGHRDPQLPAHRGAVLLRVRAPRDRHQPVLLRLRRQRPDRLHLGLRLRGAAVGHQLRPGRPGRGGPGHRPDLHPVAARRSCCPRRSGPRCRRWAA